MLAPGTLPTLNRQTSTRVELPNEILTATWDVYGSEQDVRHILHGLVARIGGREFATSSKQVVFDLGSEWKARFLGLYMVFRRTLPKTLLVSFCQREGETVTEVSASVCVRGFLASRKAAFGLDGAKVRRVCLQSLYDTLNYLEDQSSR
jgi:hypothetical protein